MTRTAVLGFPRIGPDRELKYALEAHWRGEASADELHDVAREIRTDHLQRADELGIDVVPTGDLSLYDQVLDTAVMVGAIPPRFADKSGLARYFAMARGTDEVRPLEMTKWFDTNYHYLVPEIPAEAPFELDADRQVELLEEALALGLRARPRPVVVGPLSFLLLSKVEGADPLAPLPELVEVYVELLEALSDAGAEEVQIDEPCLVEPRSEAELEALRSVWERLAEATDLRLTLATYFEGLDVRANLEHVLAVPADEFHLDLTRASSQLEPALKRLSDRDDRPHVSLGVIDGRNVWIADLDRALEQADRAVEVLGDDRVTLAVSCSLLHVPYSAAAETGIDPRVRSWLAFADEKLRELGTLGDALDADDDERGELLETNRTIRRDRQDAEATFDQEVRERTEALGPDDLERGADYAERRAAQADRLPLPDLPTTTIGSYPQTGEIRRQRAAHRRGEITTEAYEDFLQEQMAEVIAFQEEVGLDVLVHGEPERSDMVAYFADRLEGFALPEAGWVQSYGSRCVRPPILYGDVSRPEPITVRWWERAQALTDRPVKGMLTGPVTILEWSFVRDDQPRAETCRQIALAVRDEVADLDAAGAPVIQIDEAAFREGVPLHPEDREAYLRWAVETFRLAAAAASPSTQLHAHMCYSDFNDIIDDVASLDADVLLIEASRSDMELLEAFADFDYPNAIGPGIYDIHSPRVPSVEEMDDLLEAAERHLDRSQLWVTPDCGLKTRSWEDIRPALENMVEAARRQRERDG